MTSPTTAVGVHAGPIDEIETGQAADRPLAWPTAGLVIVSLSLALWAVIGGTVVLLIG